MIKVNNLQINKKSFQLGPIDLELEGGYVYAITGNSGSGKTVFLQTLLGAMPSETNAIIYNSLNFQQNAVEIKKLYSYVADKPLFSDTLQVNEVLYKIKNIINKNATLYINIIFSLIIRKVNIIIKTKFNT